MLQGSLGGALGILTRRLRHPLVGDTAWLAAVQYGTTALSAIATIAVARLLGPTEYGRLALIISYPLLVGSFLGIKSSTVTTRYMSVFWSTGQHEQFKSLCKLGYVLGVLTAVLGLAVVTITGWWVARHLIGLPGAGLMVAYAAATPLWSLLETSVAVVSASQRFRWLACFHLIERLVPPATVIILLLAGFGVPGAVLGTAIGNAVIGLVTVAATTYLLARDGVGLWWQAPLSHVRPLRREIATALGWNFLRVTWGGILTQVPVLLLGRLRGYEEAGFFRLATSLVFVGSYLEAALGRVTYPILSSRWGSTERRQMIATLKRWTLQAGLPASAVVLAMIPMLPVIVPALFGPSYKPMVPGAQLMMVGAAVAAAFFWLDAFYFASGKIGRWTRAYGLYATLVVVLAWACIGRWGFVGLAVLLTVARVAFTLSMAVKAVAAEPVGGAT